MITIDGGTGTILHNGTNYKSGGAIQTVNTHKTDGFTTTSTDISSSPKGVAVTGFTASITPTSASNKVLVRAVFGMSNSNAGYYSYAYLYRGTTELGGATIKGESGGGAIETVVIERLDTPNTTSSTTYSIRLAGEGNTAKIGDTSSGGTQDNVNDSTLTLMEIAA